MTPRASLRFSMVCGLVAVGLLTIHGVPSVAEAQSDVGSDGAARALFAEARAAYDAQHFEDAARAFRRAYLLSPRYELLYNIGQSELRAGHDALALEAFEAFLRQAPQDNANRSEVAERARVLRSIGVTAATSPDGQPSPAPTRASPTATPTPVVATHDVTPPPASATPVFVAPEGTPPITDEPPLAAASLPRSDDGPGATPWVIFASGAAVLVVGGVLMGVGASSAADVTGAPDGSRWADLKGPAGDANVMWGVGMALAGVGLAAGAVGLVWALTGSSSRRADAPTARLRVSPFGLALEGEF